MQQADPIETYRLQANLKSIHRTDTAVQAILSTSNYATIYHYEQDAGPTGEGEWVKQKAEGPLFVVQRNASPEHAIFMLNRQTVKNVTIPLVPGEMKVTAVGAGMLQIARRGEIADHREVRRGVWFSEGEPMVDQFRQTILRICGEPSARPQAPAAPVAQAAAPPALPNGTSASPAPSGAMGGQDGLSRLFAGLMPASIPTPGAALPTQESTQQQPRVAAHSEVPTLPNGAAPPHTSTPPRPASIVHSAPIPAHPVNRPGETVDDLLNSILGVGTGKSLGAPAGATTTVPTPFSPPSATQAAPPAPALSSQAQQPFERSSTPNHPLPPDALHVGTASPFPLASNPHMRTASPLPAHIRSPAAQGSGMGSSSPAPFPPAHASMPNVAHRMNGGAIDPGIAANMAVVDVLQRALPDLRHQGKEGLAKTVTALIANEPRFVDDLWEAYLRRMNGAPG